VAGATSATAGVAVASAGAAVSVDTTGAAVSVAAGGVVGSGFGSAGFVTSEGIRT
jgi:hypothetical protein